MTAQLLALVGDAVVVAVRAGLPGKVAFVGNPVGVAVRAVGNERVAKDADSAVGSLDQLPPPVSIEIGGGRDEELVPVKLTHVQHERGANLPRPRFLIKKREVAGKLLVRRVPEVTRSRSPSPSTPAASTCRVR
jgi:hypothetical protein